MVSLKSRFQNLRTTCRRGVYKLKHDVLTLDNIVIIVAVLLCFGWTWGSVSSMSRNWELAEQVAEAERRLALLQLEVETMRYENEYYASDEYLELEARRLQEKVMPGEVLVYLPENSDTAKHKHDNDDEPTTVAEQAASNLEQWLQFLFGS